MIVESSMFRNIDNSKVSVGLKNLHISFTPKKKSKTKEAFHLWSVHFWNPEKWLPVNSFDLHFLEHWAPMRQIQLQMKAT